MQNAASPTLPAGFADLEPLVADWSLPTMAARRQKRLDSSAAERQQFYAAMAPRVAAALDYLDGFALHELAQSQNALLYLALALAEISLSIEVFNPEVEARHAPASRKVAIRREMDGR